MSSRRFVLPSVVLSLALVACDGGTKDAAPSPTPSVVTTTATTTPTPSPIAKPTATATAKPTVAPTVSPSPSKSGLPQATGPAPKHFRPKDFSFIGASFGWALGEVCDASASVCKAVVARTTDAGRSWHETTAPNANTGDDVKAIRMGNQNDGWIFGPELWATHNGGKSWTQLPTDGDVLALEQAKSVTWLLVSSCEAGGCKLSVWTAPSSSDHFTLRGLVPAGDAREKEFQLVRSGSSYGWVSGWGNGDSQLFRTTDGGKTWKEIANPCKTQTNYYQRLSRFDNAHLWLVCGADGAAGSQGKAVYHSTDAGSHWGSKNNGPQTGLLSDLQALGATQSALMSTSHSGLLRTSDGGITWKVVAPDCCDAGFGKIETINFTNVWAIGHGANAIFSSSDKGRTWRKYVFPE